MTVVIFFRLEPLRHDSGLPCEKLIDFEIYISG